MAVIHIGTITTLGAVPIASCTDGDVAYIWHESFNRKMVFDDDGTNATDEANHPYYRRPDDYVDGGVWIEDVGDGQPEAWSGKQIKTGMITSTNWAAAAGSGYDLDNANFKLGGSNVTAAGAAAGIFMGLDSGAYKFYAGDGSTKYIKFDGTDVEISGLISSSYLLSSSLLTAGTYLAESCLAAAATITGGDFSSDTEWPAGGGSGWIIDSANDRDAFTYTGKTATTLTGCSGVFAHTVSATNKPLVVPVAKGMYFADCVNELRFYGDRGDGTIEELANIGIKQGGSDYAVGYFGSGNSGKVAVYAKSDSSNAVYGDSFSGNGIVGNSYSGYGVLAFSDLAHGVYGTTESANHAGVVGDNQSSSPGGIGVYGYSPYGYGVYGISSESHAVYSSGSLALKERSSDADPPEEGEAVFWMSDGTGTGDDGDVLLQVKADGSTETYTLTDVHEQNTDTGTSNNFTMVSGKYLATDKVRAVDGDGLYLVDDGDNGIFVEDGGQIGIGTASPSALVHLYGSDARMIIQDDNNAGSYFLIDDSASNNVGLKKYNAVAEQTFMVFDILTVDGQNAIFRFFRSTNTSGAKTVDFFKGDNTATKQGQIGVDGANSYFQIGGGGFGIGTASPNQKLTVEGTISLKEQADASADTAAYGQMWVHDTTPNELWFTDDAGTDTQISPHPLDAPEGMYVYGAGIDWIQKRVQPYLGVIFWQTIDGVVTEETFDEYNARRKNIEGHKDKIKQDWDTVQTAKIREELKEAGKEVSEGEAFEDVEVTKTIEVEEEITDAFEEVEITESIQTGTKKEYRYSIDNAGKVKVASRDVPVAEKQGTGKFEKQLKKGVWFDTETGVFKCKVKKDVTVTERKLKSGVHEIMENDESTGVYHRPLTNEEADALTIKAPGMPKWMQDWTIRKKNSEVKS